MTDGTGAGAGAAVVITPSATEDDPAAAEEKPVIAGSGGYEYDRRAAVTGGGAGAALDRSGEPALYAAVTGAADADRRVGRVLLRYDEVVGRTAVYGAFQRLGAPALDTPALNDWDSKSLTPPPPPPLPVVMAEAVVPAIPIGGAFAADAVDSKIFRNCCTRINSALKSAFDSDSS